MIKIVAIIYQDIVWLSLVTRVKYWFISHFDKRFTVVEYIREQIIIDSTEVSKNIGQVFSVSLYRKPRVVMTPPLSSPGALQVVITMVTCGNHSDDKVGFMIIMDFRYYTHGLVNIRITIAIHFHLPRFLESESLWYCRVLDTLVWVTDSAYHSASHFEQLINFLWQISYKCVNGPLACLKIYDAGLIRSM